MDLRRTTRSSLGYYKSTGLGTLSRDSDEGHDGGSMIQGGLRAQALDIWCPQSLIHRYTRLSLSRFDSCTDIVVLGYPTDVDVIFNYPCCHLDSPSGLRGGWNVRSVKQ
jgi:hypothetical protein